MLPKYTASFRILLRVAVMTVAALLLVPGASWAREYYFSSSSGRNAQPCSAASPCQTLDKLATVALQPGDRVLLKRGDTFTTAKSAQIVVRWSGTAAQPITFSAYGTGPPPVLDGGAQGKKYSHGFTCKDRAHLTVEHLHFTNWLKGLWIVGCTNVTLRHLEVETIGGECVHFMHGAADILMEHSVVHHCGATQNGEGFYIGSNPKPGVPPDTTRGVTLRANDIYATHDEPIELKSGTREIAITDNRIHHVHLGSWGAGIVANPPHPSAKANPNHLIARNSVTQITGPYGTGIYCRTGCRIHSNIVARNSQAGIRVQAVPGLAYPVEVWNNTLIANGGAALREDAAPTVRPMNNLVWQHAADNHRDEPAFANLAAGDVRLCTGRNTPVEGCAGRSMAIDVGTDVGLPYKGTAPDLGALESEASESPHPPPCPCPCP